MAENGTAAELVQELRRQGVRAFCLPGLDGVHLAPAEAVTPDLRKLVEARVVELDTHLRAQGGAEDEDLIAFKDLNGAATVWIGLGSLRGANAP